MLEPSETVTINATFTNFGGAASNLTVGFTSSDANVSWSTSSVSAGALAYGNSYRGTFTFTVGANTPVRHMVYLATSISDGSFTDSPDIIRLRINTIPTHVTHATSSIKISVLHDGNVGTDPYANSTEAGVGFQVARSNSSWANLLFEGGLLMGTSATKLLDCVRSGNTSSKNADFVSASGTWPTLADPGSVGDQDGNVELVEASGSNANLGLEVELESYTWDAAANDDFIILHYTITNTNASTVNGLYLGLFLDWDINPDGKDDAKYNTQRKVGYVESRANRNHTAGVRMLTSEGQLAYAAINNASSLYDGFTDGEKWALLSGGVGTTTRSNGDMSQLIGAGPISIGANGTKEVAFALVTGAGSSALLTNADAAQTMWNNLNTPPQIELSVDKQSVMEEDGATTITVTASITTNNTFSSDESIPITVVGSGTETAVDFAPVSSFTMTLTAGATSTTGTFTLTPTDDTVDETNETITISSSNTSVTQSASITLVDDDEAPSGVTLSVNPSSVDEGDGATTITVSAAVEGGTTYAATQVLRITVAGSGNSGTVGFNPVSAFDLSVAAGASSGSGTFELTPIDNAADETDETITVSSSSTLVTNSATITIHDNDEVSLTIDLSVSPSSVGEGDGATTITVTVTSGGAFQDAQDIPITVAASGNAAAVGFAAVPDFTITLSAGATTTTGSFVITPVDNVVDEDNETVTVTSSHSAVSGSATLTLTDDDAAPGGIALSVSPTSINEGDGAVTITVTVAPSGGTTYAVAKTLPISVDGSGATDVVGFVAVQDFDITLSAGAASGSGTFELEPVDDTAAGATETVTVQSSSNLVTNSATITIDDNDGSSTISLGADPATISESDGAATIVVQAAIANGNAFAEDVTLSLSVAGSGMADAVDFVAVSDFNITMVAGETSGSATFQLEPIDDNSIESDETVTISSSDARVINVATVTIVNDDVLTDITLSADPDSVLEDNGAVTVTVSANIGGGGTYATDLPLPLSVVGSRTVGAVGFEAVPDFEVTVGANEVTGSTTFVLTPINDTGIGPDETVSVYSTHALVIDSAAITIVNDEASAGIVLSVDPSTVTEGSGAVTITVLAVVSGGSTYTVDLPLPLAVAGSGDPDAVDFVAVPAFEVVVTAGATSGSTTFVLEVIDDAVLESAETVTVSSSSVLVTNTGTLTLWDDDSEPAGISLAVSPDTVIEGSGATTIIVTASVIGGVGFSAEQILAISIAGSGTEASVDFSDVPDFDLILPEGELSATAAFVLTPVDDLVDEVDEVIIISSTTPLVQDSAFLMLQDDDAPPSGIMLTAVPNSIGEGDGTTSVTVTAMVSGLTYYAVRQDLTIAVTGSGVDGAVDFVPVSDFILTIPPEAAYGTQPFDLTPINDGVGEADETLTISSTHPAVLSSATIVIEDNDDGRTPVEPEPDALRLVVAPPFPNPATGTVTFIIEVPEQGRWVSLRLYNILGQELDVLFEGRLQAGENAVRFDGHALPAGLYVYVLESGEMWFTGQLVLAQ